LIERALIHVTGPQNTGKTTLIEQVLRALAFDGMVLAARCVRDDSLRLFREAAPKRHPELHRYREAGAIEAAVFTFPGSDIGSDAFYMTRLMESYSQAVVLEGDCPLSFVDLRVYVAPPLEAGGSLLVRRKRDRVKEDRKKAAAMEQLLGEPDGAARWFKQMIGGPAAAFARGSPELLEETRAHLLAGLEEVRKTPPPAATEHWAIAEGYRGIEHAQVVVVNVRADSERQGVSRLLADLDRLRKNKEIFDDVLGWRGKKTPITAVAADLADSKNQGTKKAVTRVKRSLRKFF